MKKRRDIKPRAPKLIARVLLFRIPHAGKFGCLILAVIPFTCCVFCVSIFIPRGPTHQPPNTISERKDGEGNVVARIIQEPSYMTTGPFPGPHGPFMERKYSYKYFLEETSKQRRELTFLENERLSGYRGQCEPVENTTRWVAVGQVLHPRIEHKIWILMFDGERINRRRIQDLNPHWQSGPTWRFEDGNRKVVYQGPQGSEAYDVITDTVVPWKPAKN